MNVSVFGSLYAQMVTFLVINLVISNIQMEDTCRCQVTAKQAMRSKCGENANIGNSDKATQSNTMKAKLHSKGQQQISKLTIVIDNLNCRKLN